MNNLVQKFVNTVRSHTPLWLHWKLGPLAARAAYYYRIYISGNKDAPKILSINKTLDLVARENLSVIRFGDGEMTIMQQTGLGFQKYDGELVKRLKEIIHTEKKGLLICLPDLFGKLDDYAEFATRFALHHQLRYRQEWLNILTPDRIYGNTFITRPYLGFREGKRQQSGEIFEKIFSIWQGKNICLIEGEKSRIGVGNNMFEKAASVKRILCPAENAYSKYDQILKASLEFNKESIVLISLGPAAKVLAYDLFLAGFRVLDIGHLDMEYEMFVRKQPYQTKVKYKYFNEIHERNPEDCKDPLYLSQIVAKIL